MSRFRVLHTMPPGTERTGHATEWRWGRKEKVRMSVSGVGGAICSQWGTGRARGEESQEFHLTGSVQGWGVRERQIGSRRVECTFGNSRFCKVPWGSWGGS